MGWRALDTSRQTSAANPSSRACSTACHQDHELIDSGPYALVRHPIYAGLLVAFAGSALARGEWPGLLAVLVALVAFSAKLRVEERWMVGRFGERYLAYRRRVPALVPTFARPRTRHAA